MGVTFIGDKGKGIIHPNEPSQALFLDRKAYEVVDKLKNEHDYQPPKDIDFDDVLISPHLYNNRIVSMLYYKNPVGFSELINEKPFFINYLPKNKELAIHYLLKYKDNFESFSKNPKVFEILVETYGHNLEFYKKLKPVLGGLFANRNVFEYLYDGGKEFVNGIYNIFENEISQYVTKTVFFDTSFVDYEDFVDKFYTPLIKGFDSIDKNSSQLSWVEGMGEEQWKYLVKLGRLPMIKTRGMYESLAEMFERIGIEKFLEYFNYRVVMIVLDKFYDTFAKMKEEYAGDIDDIATDEWYEYFPKEEDEDDDFEESASILTRLSSLVEAPIIYDDETRGKVGTVDDASGLKWSEPPAKDASMEEVQEWVSIMVRRKVLKLANLGQGKSKIAKFNDNKTVFKWNHDVTEFGDQIEEELRIYRRFGKKYSDVLPVLYDSGDNWLIQELLVPVEDDYNEFERITGVPFHEFDEMKDQVNYAWQDTLNMIGKVSFDKFHKVFTDNFIRNTVGKQREVLWNKLWNNNNIKRIFMFGIDAKVSIADFHDGNVGMTKDGKIKVIDFGVT